MSSSCEAKGACSRRTESAAGWSGVGCSPVLPTVEPVLMASSTYGVQIESVRHEDFLECVEGGEEEYGVSCEPQPFASRGALRCTGDVDEN